MVIGGKSTGFLAVPGSIITTVGLILLVQKSFGMWETWSYLWTLIFCAVGLGLVIQGTWSGLPDLRKRGWELARAGVILFLIFSIMMEFIFTATGVSGRASSPVWPALLIIIGLYQLVTRIYRLASRKAGPQDGDLFGPVFLSGVGALVLLTNLRLIPSWNLFDLLQLWPLLLIGGGLQLLLGRRNPWVSALIGLLIVAAVLAVAITGFRFGG
jgi:hypothetical protein